MRLVLAKWEMTRPGITAELADSISCTIHQTNVADASLGRASVLAPFESALQWTEPLIRWPFI